MKVVCFSCFFLSKFRISLDVLRLCLRILGLGVSFSKGVLFKKSKFRFQRGLLKNCLCFKQVVGCFQHNSFRLYAFEGCCCVSFRCGFLQGSFVASRLRALNGFRLLR